MRSTDAARGARVGLIVNPVAGLGGAAGLKGSDAPDVRTQVAERGHAAERAARALRRARAEGADPVLLAWPGEMGGDVAAAAGLALHELPDPPTGPTTAADTRAAVAACQAAGARLLLVAGGDGTMRDLVDVAEVPVVAVPSGVKMHSAVFAVTPDAAGVLLAHALRDALGRTVTAEVADLEASAPAIEPRLYGTLEVPAVPGLVQHAKARGAVGATVAIEAVAAAAAERLRAEPGRAWVVGPGTTTLAALAVLGLEGTLLGVDVVEAGEVIARDVDRRTLEAVLAGRSAGVLLAPIGGQGFLVGRGNQQIPPGVVASAAPAHLVVAATDDKLAALQGRPLLVDSGDPVIDAALAGWVRVVVAPGRDVVYPVAGPV